jgi:SAM-dependent methyltransferase
VNEWWRVDGVPDPPPLSDKLIDWRVLAAMGGTPFMAVRRVLELGPGFGLDALMFAGGARLYVVLDASAHVLAWVRRLAPAARCVLADVQALPFRAGAFDLVLDFSTVDNCGEPMRAYREVVHVLTGAPGTGVLITTYANALKVGMRDGEFPQEPEYLAHTFAAFGLRIRYRSDEDGARAAMAAQKGALG